MAARLGLNYCIAIGNQSRAFFTVFIHIILMTRNKTSQGNCACKINLLGKAFFVFVVECTRASIIVYL